MKIAEKMFQMMSGEGCRQVTFYLDPKINMKAILVVDSLPRGNCSNVSGGTRFAHKDADFALNDALKLSKSMTRKSKVLGVKEGGAKAVVIADQVKDAAFCQQSTFSNLKTPCLISKVACKSINNGGNCPDGTCDNKDCESNPNSPACQWKNGKGNVKVESFAFCGNSTDIMMKMIALSNNSDQWAPQPPPPITIAISIIGGLIILITVVWYILLLIRKERQMGKK